MLSVQCHNFILRPWRPEDAESLTAMANNIHIWDNVRDYFPHPYRRTDADAFIALATGRPQLQDFAVEVEGKAVGGVGFVPGTDVERVSVEVGYWLGEPYWGRGIASAAVRALCEYIFASTEIQRLYATVFEFNYASMRVLEKAGFHKKTIFRRAAVKNGRVIDLHYYELTRDEFCEAGE